MFNVQEPLEEEHYKLIHSVSLGYVGKILADPKFKEVSIIG